MGDNQGSNKPDENKQVLLEKYTERYISWDNRYSSQMSFYNNLLLTLGIGFLSLAYKNSGTQLSISLTGGILRILSEILISFSVLTGLMASLSRLYDFRITKQINLIRKRAWERSNKRLSEGTSEEYHFYERMCLLYRLVLRENYPKITLEECGKWEEKGKELNEKFKELRTITHNLGIGTWSKVKWQTGFLFLGIIFYVFSEISQLF